MCEISKKFDNLLLLQGKNSQYYLDTDKLLGSGGYGEVYRCYDHKKQHTWLCAKRILLRKQNLKKEEQEEYLNKIKVEIAAYEKINQLKKCDPSSQYVVHAVDIFEQNSYLYFIQEYCNSGNFEDYLKSRTFFSENEIKSYLLQICQGISFLHHLGIVHRDLKLNNIFIHNYQQLKIGDFGSAKHIEDEYSFEHFGTKGWKAPETESSQSSDSPSIDIWSIGIIVYYLLYGYDSQTYEQFQQNLWNFRTQFNQGEKCDLEFPNSRIISDTYKEIIKRCLCIDQKNRITLDEIIELLQNFHSHSDNDFDLQNLRENYGHEIRTPQTSELKIKKKQRKSLVQWSAISSFQEMFDQSQSIEDIIFNSQELLLESNNLIENNDENNQRDDEFSFGHFSLDDIKEEDCDSLEDLKKNKQVLNQVLFEEKLSQQLVDIERQIQQAKFQLKAGQNLDTLTTQIKNSQSLIEILEKKGTFLTKIQDFVSDYYISSYQIVQKQDIEIQTILDNYSSKLSKNAKDIIYQINIEINDLFEILKNSLNNDLYENNHEIKDLNQIGIQCLQQLKPIILQLSDFEKELKFQILKLIYFVVLNCNIHEYYQSQPKWKLILEKKKLNYQIVYKEIEETPIENPFFQFRNIHAQIQFFAIQNDNCYNFKMYIINKFLRKCESLKVLGSLFY